MRTALSLIVRATRCNRRYSKSRLREAGYGWVVEADITAYFDNVDHSLLFARVAELAPDEKVTELIRLWMAARVYDGRQLTKLTKGCLRDHRFHPLLANLYLDTFDERMLSVGQQLVRAGIRTIWRGCIDLQIAHLIQILRGEAEKYLPLEILDLGFDKLQRQ